MLWERQCQTLQSRLPLRAVELLQVVELLRLAFLLQLSELEPALVLAFSLKALPNASPHRDRWYQSPLVLGLYAREELQLLAFEGLVQEQEQVPELVPEQQVPPEEQAQAWQPQLEQVLELEQVLVPELRAEQQEPLV